MFRTGPGLLWSVFYVRSIYILCSGVLYFPCIFYEISGFYFQEIFVCSQFGVIFEFVFPLKALFIMKINFKWIFLFSSRIHSWVTITYILFIYVFVCLLMRIVVCFTYIEVNGKWYSSDFALIISTQIIFSMNIISKFYRWLYCNSYFECSIYCR